MTFKGNEETVAEALSYAVGSQMNLVSADQPDAPSSERVSPHLTLSAMNLSRFPSMSLAERMADSHGVPVTHETVAKFNKNLDAQDDELANELQTVFLTLQKCIDIRHRYMETSLQMPGDNPKGTACICNQRIHSVDKDTWPIYPPPPPPSYPPPEKPHVREEFDLKKCEIPGAHSVSLFPHSSDND